MAVVGTNCLIVEDTGKTTKVKPFIPEYNDLEAVPIVDVGVKWTCPYDEKDYKILITNALYAPSMNMNLILPFLMREAGLIVNDIPKIMWIIHVKRIIVFIAKKTMSGFPCH